MFSIVTGSLLALDSKFGWGRCLSHVGTEGAQVPALLRLGVSVVLDFAGNTVAHRAWVRSLFEAAGADHVLHWLDASDDACLANLHRRNDEQPPGVYWGHVSDELFHAITPYFQPPTEDEGFHVVRRVGVPTTSQ
jgi:hypothetical protein